MKFTFTVASMVFFCGCGDFRNDSNISVITFTGLHEVSVNGRIYDVSDKEKSFKMRRDIRDSRELVFENLGKSSARALWNIIDPKPTESEFCTLAPVVCTLKLGNGEMVPLFFGPRCSYFDTEDASDEIGITAVSNENPETIDFSVLDSIAYKILYLEIWCDFDIRQCDNLENIISEFIKHGEGEHQVYLLYY